MSFLSVKNICKEYKIYPSKWARLKSLMFPGVKTHSVKRVLDDISFEISPGESVGIVGINGAGKSTLLKIISNITNQTSGEVVVEGRVAALLELGMGFHPDFTGRANLYMSGQLIGLSRGEIDRLMPSIEDFSEIGSYIDQPVRTYSSGMQVRLAFSLATAVRPDLLIVDEALSVGDAYFQHKSFERIREFRAKGTTLLIVSHNRAAIQAICDRAILLSGGKIVSQGKPDIVLDFYSALLAERQQELISQRTLADGSIQTTSGTGEVEISSVVLQNESGSRVDVVEVGTPVSLVVDVLAVQPVSRLVLGFLIKDSLGQPVYGINTHRLDKPVDDLCAGDRYRFRFEFPASIGKGNYSVSLSASRLDSHLDKNYHWIDRALIFSVINTRLCDFVGVAMLDVDSSVEKVSAIDASLSEA